METAEKRPVENAMKKREVEKPVMGARICGNPDCARVWADPHVTICLDCGWGTRKLEVD